MKGTALKIAGVVLILLSIVLMATNIFGYWTEASYKYRINIGAYVDNAYDASTFEVMKSQLLNVIGGMHKFLSTTDCGRAWSWEQTQDWCMAYQYKYLDGLVNRTDYYIRIFTLNNTSPFTDVYTQAISHMRDEFKRNGPADWVAEPAFLLKYYPQYYWGALYWLEYIGMLVFGFLLIFAGFAVADSEKYDSGRKPKDFF